MHSSCNLIKSSNTSVKGDIEIVTECVVTEEEQHFQEKIGRASCRERV